MIDLLLTYAGVARSSTLIFGPLLLLFVASEARRGNADNVRLNDDVDVDALLARDDDVDALLPVTDRPARATARRRAASSFTPSADRRARPRDRSGRLSRTRSGSRSPSARARPCGPSWGTARTPAKWFLRRPGARDPRRRVLPSDRRPACYVDPGSGTTRVDGNGRTRADEPGVADIVDLEVRSRRCGAELGPPAEGRRVE
jgi:hypothetical protein